MKTNRKLVISTGMGFEMSELEQLEILANIGWDGVFPCYSVDDDNQAIANKIKACGLYFQSIHAPFYHCDKMWENGEATEKEIATQIKCVQFCSENQVNLMVMHSFIGFDKHSPNQIGVENFYKVIEEAQKLGVKIALENTEGEEYLDTLMKAFKENDNVGFCIDTGHEMCYNESRDLITKYGKKLICTHLNDNMKITGDKITWLDDSHLMPFDGLADWQGIANRLNSVNYQGPLTFELTCKNKPNRNTHDRYSHLSFEEFSLLALNKAKQFEKLIDNQ